MNSVGNSGGAHGCDCAAGSQQSGANSFASIFESAQSNGAQTTANTASSPSGAGQVSDEQSSRSQTRAEAQEARAESRAERQEARDAERAERAEARQQERAERQQARAEQRAERQETRAAERAERLEARAAERAGGGDQPAAASNVPTTNGQILGGTTDPGATIDPVNGDFTRDGGDVPIASVGVEDLGANADGTRNIRVTFTNDGPEGGTFLTPPWVAIQDGTFDIYDEGGEAAEFLERIAEDGTVDSIGEAFQSSGAVGDAGVITGPDGLAAGPLDPGESGSIVLTVDPTQSQFLNFASMVIPSNDAFISSPDNPTALQIFDDQGNFTGGEFSVTGADVLDAGTEVNTEQDAAFLNQTAPDTGVDEGGVVTAHPGFIGSEGLPATDTAASFPDRMISARY